MPVTIFTSKSPKIQTTSRDSGRLSATPLALQRMSNQNEQLFEVSDEIVSFCEASRV